MLRCFRGSRPACFQVTVRVEGSGATCEAQLPPFVVPVGFSCGDRVCGLFNDLILDGNADGAFELVEGDLVAVWLALVVDGVHLPMIPPTPALNNEAHDGPEMLAPKVRDRRRCGVRVGVPGPDPWRPVRTATAGKAEPVA